MPDDYSQNVLPGMALLIIDMQRDFCDAGGYAARAGMDIRGAVAVIEPIRALLQAARLAGIMVIHTREGHLPDLSDCPPEKRRRSRNAGAEIGSMGPLGRLLVRGEYGHGIIEELAPWDGELVLDKPGYSAFHRTGLDDVLNARAVQTLILCGVTTEVCVHSTLRAAVDHGYCCLTVSDACAAGDPALQQPALEMIRSEGGIFGTVATTAGIVDLLGSRPALPARSITA